MMLDPTTVIAGAISAILYVGGKERAKLRRWRRNKRKRAHHRKEWV